MATPRTVHPYRKPPRVEKVIANLVDNFGYGKLEARKLAVEVCDNLDRHADFIEATIKRLANQTQKRPTQTAFWRENSG